MSTRHEREQAFIKAKRRHRVLIAVLGGRCCECGEDGTDIPLTVDHLDGITWKHRSKRLDARVSTYWREYLSGVRLRVLCMECNGRDGQRRGMQTDSSGDDEPPF